MKLLFFGSTDFSLPMVRNIHVAFKVSGVVISKPKPKGRGLKQSLPKIAQWAESVSVKVYMPEDPNSESFLGEMTSLAPDLYVLSAYGHILGRKLLEIPRYGGINIHPSLLPRYRGAAPIQRAIMAGEEKTGVTIFFMDEKIDHGEMIVQRSIPIEKDDTYGSLSEKLSDLGAEMIIDTLRRVESGDCHPVRQEGEVSYAPKIQKSEMLIDWTDGATAIYNRIRALSPRPGARTYFRGKELMITQAQISGKKMSPPGALMVEEKKLHVGTGSGSLVLVTVKPEGKNVISAYDFINGYRIQEGEVLG
jgi:methionyl-tRNA formyltransferase